MDSAITQESMFSGAEAKSSSGGGLGVFFGGWGSCSFEEKY